MAFLVNCLGIVESIVDCELLAAYNCIFRHVNCYFKFPNLKSISSYYFYRELYRKAVYKLHALIQVYAQINIAYCQLPIANC